MSRFLLAAFAFLLSAGLTGPAAQAQSPTDLPARPAPFRFVNDQAQLMAPADAKKLESGLRRYADNTGTQVVVVTVPSLGGRDVADYGRALGEAWGVGQRDKNNGVVVLIGAQEHKVTIQPGSGLTSSISPTVVNQIISQMTPSFKQGNYFAGLRGGLNTLMLKANPDSNPQKNQANAATESAAAANAAAAGPNRADEASAPATPDNYPTATQPMPEPASSGPGMGTLLIGALVIGGILWFVVRMFRNRSANNAASYPSQNPNLSQPNAAPNFLPNRPNGPAGGYGPGQQGNYGGQNSGGLMGGGGMGMGGMLATGAAAAAGAYLGNRMASGHDTGSNGLNTDGNSPQHFDPNTAAGAGAAGAAGGSDYFASRDGAPDNAAPDYFSNDDAAGSTSSDYFTSDDNNSSYDDTSSSDTGGGGFDGDSGGSGSW